MILASEVIFIILTIFFVPPGQPLVIFLFIGLVSVFIYSLTRLKIPRKYSVLSSLFAGFLLGLLALGVFDIINIALLVSLFVGLSVLLK